MTITPYDWQLPSIERGLAILKDRRFLLNTSGTGTGKTVVTLAICKALASRALCLCPKAVKTAWGRTAPDMGYSGLVDIMNPEKLQYTNPYYVDRKWHLDGIDTVILDELHRGASGVKSKTTRIMAELKAYPVKVIALSATIADSPLKLRCAGFHAGLHEFNTQSYNRFCIANACFMRPGTSSLMFDKGPRGIEAMKRISEALAPYRIHIDSDTAPGFPESLVQSKLFDLSKDYTDQFNSIMAELPEKLKDSTVTNPLTMLLRARQKTELLKVPVLVDCISEALEEGLAPVVFVNFRETIQELQSQLKAMHVSFSTIIGGQSVEERDRNIDTFMQDGTQVMLATLAAGGVGISLHARRDSNLRNRTSFITPNFSAAEFVQTLGRIHRAGGHNVVQTIILAAGTVEERIHKALQGKLARLDLINDGDLV